MHIITRKRLNEFVEKYPDTRVLLEYWYVIMKKNRFQSLAKLKDFFPSADQVGKLTIFNIGGNKVRLIAAIHYNRNKLYIRAIQTHGEYNKGKWRE